MSGNARRSRNFFRDLMNWNVPGNEDSIKPEFIPTADLITTVYDGIVANNTTNATTTILNYGVNVVTTVTLTNKAAKLPQPVTGKTVKVVNMGANPLLLFPSNVGGQINNYPINAPATVPADGKLYEFICIENPLPGAWVWSAPAINQIELPEVTINHTSGTPSAAYVATQIYSTPQGGTLDVNGNIQLSSPGCLISLPYAAASTKSKYYTNILAGDVNSSVNPIVIERIAYYKVAANTISSVGGNDYVPFLPTAVSTASYSVNVAPVGSLNSPILPGDTGTFYAETLVQPSVPNLGTGGAFSSYYWLYAINIPASVDTKVYKFKIFVEFQ